MIHTTRTAGFRDSETEPGPPLLEGDQAAPGPLAHGLSAVADLELGVEGRDVELDGVLADVELLGYEPVGESPAEQLQHLALARGQGFGELLDRGQIGRAHV